MIVDDQTEAVELLVDHVKKIPFLQLEMVTTDSVEALSFFNEGSVDLIFLDVQMPDITGIDFLESLKERLGEYVPKVILTTGYDSYALSGYDHGVFDYLLKPISFKRFKKSVDRIYHEFRKVESTIVEDKRFFFADADGKKIKVNYEDILFIEGARNYIYIVTVKSKLIILKSMNSIQEILPRENFERVHKSYIVAIEQIHAIKGNEIIISVNEQLNKRIPIGITYKENFLKKLGIKG